MDIEKKLDENLALKLDELKQMSTDPDKLTEDIAKLYKAKTEQMKVQLEVDQLEFEKNKLEKTLSLENEKNEIEREKIKTEQEKIETEREEAEAATENNKKEHRFKIIGLIAEILLAIAGIFLSIGQTAMILNHEDNDFVSSKSVGFIQKIDPTKWFKKH